MTDASTDPGAVAAAETADGTEIRDGAQPAAAPPETVAPLGPRQAAVMENPAADIGDASALSEAGQAASLGERPADAPTVTARELSMIAAVGAAIMIQEAIRDPSIIDLMLDKVPGGSDMKELIGILDNSPDLPASAIVKFLNTKDIQIQAAEALKATYVGLAPWVKAEGERLAAELEATRIKGTSRYEKHGREERVGAKIVDQAEKDRIARNQPGGLAIGEVSEEGKDT
jgi:hypothetical protein